MSQLGLHSAVLLLARDSRMHVFIVPTLDLVTFRTKNGKPCPMANSASYTRASCATELPETLSNGKAHVV